MSTSGVCVRVYMCKCFLCMCMGVCVCVCVIFVCIHTILLPPPPHRSLSFSSPLSHPPSSLNLFLSRIRWGAICDWASKHYKCSVNYTDNWLHLEQDPALLQAVEGMYVLVHFPIYSDTQRQSENECIHPYFFSTFPIYSPDPA